MILDGPAILGLADCRVLGRIVDSSLLVVRSGSMQLITLHRAKAMLEQSHVAIAGVVFNGFRRHQQLVELRLRAASFSDLGARISHRERPGNAGPGRRRDLNGTTCGRHRWRDTGKARREPASQDLCWRPIA